MPSSASGGPLAAPASPRVPAETRSPEEGGGESSPKRIAPNLPQGETRIAEVPIENIDPQSPTASGSILAAIAEICAEHLDEDPVEMPPDAWDALEGSDLSRSPLITGRSNAGMKKGTPAP